MPPIGDQLDLPGSVSGRFIVARALLRPGRTYDEAVDAFAPYDRIQDPNPELRRDLAAPDRDRRADPDPRLSPRQQPGRRERAAHHRRGGSACCRGSLTGDRAPRAAPRYAILSIIAALATIGLKASGVRRSPARSACSPTRSSRWSTSPPRWWRSSRSSVAARPADEEHPTGTARPSTSPAAFEGALILLAAASIVVRAGRPPARPRSRSRSLALGLAHHRRGRADQPRRRPRAPGRGPAPRVHHPRGRRAIT